MQMDTSFLKERILDEIKDSPPSREIEDIAIEPDVDDDGDNFLRVTIRLKDRDKTADEELERLLEVIETAVGELDERYPSIRFLDAA